MKSFITRVLSSVVALAILFSLYYFAGAVGFKILVAMAIFISSLELVRILFPQESVLWKSIFYIFSLVIFSTFSMAPLEAPLVLSVLFIALTVLCLIFNSSWTDLADLQKYISKCLLGWVYLALLPSYVWRLLDLTDGVWWFLTLLAVVFGCDIGAYLVGVLFGKTKILPRVSPKKSLQGSIGGILGSLLAMTICIYLAPKNGLVIQVTDQFSNARIYLLLLAPVSAFCSQAGDFFESLLKRIAAVKDSGSIMPGHGGILDRIDGVLFASPVFFAAAFFFELVSRS